MHHQTATTSYRPLLAKSPSALGQLAARAHGGPHHLLSALSTLCSQCPRSHRASTEVLHLRLYSSKFSTNMSTPSAPSFQAGLIQREPLFSHQLPIDVRQCNPFCPCLFFRCTFWKFSGAKPSVLAQDFPACNASAAALNTNVQQAFNKDTWYVELV